MRRGLLGLLAAPILIAQCAPPQCSPAPVEPAPPVETPAPPPEPPAAPVPVPETTAAPTSTAPVPTAWSFLRSNGAGQYSRWSGCKNPIRWQLDTTIGPTDAFRTALADALATAAAATGHSFEFAGDAGALLAPGVEAVIGLTDLPTGLLGRGGGSVTSSLEMVRGTAYVDVALASPGQEALLRSTLIHEIAHLLGLGHAEDTTQVMYRILRLPPLQQYQWGDLEGLRLVGATMPCLASLLADDDGPTTEIILD